jgi:hypothetical protein
MERVLIRKLACCERLSPAHAEEETAAAQEPETTHETDEGEDGRRDQEEVEESGSTVVGRRLDFY